MRIKKLLLLSLIVAFGLSSCTKSNDLSSAVVRGDVFLAGYVFSGPSLKYVSAGYWRNNELVRLSPDLQYSMAFGIGTLEQDIYVAGDTGFIGLKSNTAACWKNGQLQILAAKGSHAASLFISGSDVYIAGSVTNSSGVLNAVYWKNGVVNQLAGDPAKPSEATGIYVSGNDVYVAGSSQVSGVANPTYWKNNAPTVYPLAFNTRAASASAIAVSGNDVHLAGWSLDDRTATYHGYYWKNGVIASVSTNPVKPSGIAVAGNDVHIIGHEMNGSASFNYFKNGTGIALGEVANGVVDPVAIQLYGPDVYIAGNITPVTGSYWKNGAKQIELVNAQVKALCVAK